MLLAAFAVAIAALALRGAEEDTGGWVAFRNTSPDVAWIGSRACEACHQAECSTYGGTSHGRSFGRVGPDTEPLPGDLYHRASGLQYTIAEEDGEVRVRAAIPLWGGREEVLEERTLRYFFGSGIGLRSYVAEIDGRLCEAPVSSYPKLEEQWAMTPGFEGAHGRGFTHAVDWQCVSCHVGRVEEEVDEAGVHLRIHEEPIGCESCHGPGGLHAEHHRGTPPGTRSGRMDATIANPRRMGREQLNDTCGRCHLPADLLVANRGKRLADWRPGLPLSEFRIRYRQDPPDGITIDAGYADQLTQSLCYQRSDMTCLSCHDMHVPLAREARARHYQDRCLACHGADDCTEEPARRAAQADQGGCLVCHMPRSPFRRNHAPFKHHRIGIHRDEGRPRAPAASDGGGGADPTQAAQPLLLEPVDDVSHLDPAERQRSLGLAYVRRLAAPIGRSEAKEATGVRARELLEPEEGEKLDDPVRMVALCLLAKESEVALRLAQDALESDVEMPHFVRITALARASTLLFDRQELDAAEERVLELTRRRRDASDWLLLMRIARAREDQAGAIRALEEALRIAPHDPGAHRLAGEVFAWAGDTARSRRHELLAEHLRARRGRAAPR
jgi:hypothetical protein